MGKNRQINVHATRYNCIICPFICWCCCCCCGWSVVLILYSCVRPRHSFRLSSSLTCRKLRPTISVIRQQSQITSKYFQTIDFFPRCCFLLLLLPYLFSDRYTVLSTSYNNRCMPPRSSPPHIFGHIECQWILCNTKLTGMKLTRKPILIAEHSTKL